MDDNQPKPQMIGNPVGLKPGEIFWNNYRVIGIIGRGGVSSVYKAENVETKELVAIKILHSQKLRDEELVRRFVREAQNTVKLENPHVVRIYEWGIDKLERPFIIMEFLSGETLAKRIDRTNGLAYQKAVDIVEQICGAMMEAHAKGIIHRDLKPENIMLIAKEDAPEEWVKVFDFGIAKMEVPEDETVSGQISLTKTGAILGTPQYMSPEQLRGKRADARSDVYALGVIMYEMLTGKPPFASKNTAEIVVGHLNVIPESPSQVRIDLNIPEELSEVVLKALAKNPWERPMTVQEFRNSLVKSIDRSGKHRTTDEAQQGYAGSKDKARNAATAKALREIDPLRKICPKCNTVNSGTSVRFCLKCGQDNQGKWLPCFVKGAFTASEFFAALFSRNALFAFFTFILIWEALSFTNMRIDLTGRYRVDLQHRLFSNHPEIAPALAKKLCLSRLDMIMDQRNARIEGFTISSFGQDALEGRVSEVNPLVMSYDIFSILNQPEGELRLNLTGTIDKIFHAKNWKIVATFHGPNHTKVISDMEDVKITEVQD